MPDLVLGHNQFIPLTNKEANVFYVEHSGRAIVAGEKDLERLEERMEILGLQPLVRRTAASTATGKLIDEEKTQSDIQAWIRSLENTLKDAFGFAAQWVKTELEEDFSIDIFSDFALADRSTTEVDTLSNMEEKGQLSRETLLRETKRRGIIADTIVVEEELARIDGDVANNE